LDHEVFDDSMKFDVVVVAALGEVEEVGDGNGNFRSEKSALNGAAGGVEDDANVIHPREYRD
jgi:hypothetical protein